VLKREQEWPVRGPPPRVASTPKAAEANAELLRASSQNKAE
jgi:hypothetical protein